MQRDDLASVTELLSRGTAGDGEAMNRAYSLLYPQLRTTAARMLGHERGGSRSMQPTGLVAEAYCKLLRLTGHIVSREHYLSIAAKAMKQLLIDRGRARSVRKRLDPQVLATQPSAAHPEPASHAAMRQVWKRLRAMDPLAAEAVWLLRVDGLTLQETAARQARPLWRVHADCAFALEWMEKKLR